MLQFSNSYRLGCLLCLTYGCLSVSSIRAQSWQQLQDRADSLNRKGNYAAAIELTKQALQRAEADSGKQSKAAVVSLAQGGSFSLSKGDFKQSEQWLLEAKNRWAAMGHRNTEEYTVILQNLVGLYRRTDRVPEGVAALAEVIQITKELAGTESSAYAQVLETAGTFYMIVNQYHPAETNLLAAHALYQRLGQTKTSIGSLLQSLGMLYEKKEDFVQAEQYAEAAIAERKRLLSADHPLYYTSLGALAAIQEKMGNHQRAIELGEQLLRQRERVMPNTQFHAIAMNNLARNYQRLKQYANRPDTLYQRALAILAKEVGTSNQTYINIQNNLASLYLQQEKFGEAAAINEQMLNAMRYDRRHPSYVTHALNLSRVYSQQRRFAEADTLFQAVMAVQQATTGRLVESYIFSLCSYAYAQRIQHRYAVAIDTLMVAQQLLDKITAQNYLSWTNDQRSAFATKWVAYVAGMLSTAQEAYQRQLPKAAELAYQTALMVKGTVLNEHVKQAQFLNQTPDTTLRRAYQFWLDNQKRLTEQYTLPVSKRILLDSLETEAERLEKAVARQSAPFRAAQQTIRTTWQDVQKALKPNEAAVEFIHFQYHNGQKITDSTLYMALVLRPGWSAPKLVTLTHEKAIAALLAKPSLRLTASLSPLRARQQTLLNTGQLTQGEALYQLIWQPLDSLLRGVRQVWVSPSGLLHKVAIAALPYPGPQSRVLADRYALRQVNTTRALTTATPTRWTANSRAQLYGGIDYSTDSTGHTAWTTLPGTLREVQAIGQVLGSSATVVTGQQATKTYLTTQPAANVLHLATHGFFQSPDSSRTDFVRSGAERTLRRSGVVLAGANRHLGADNGILSGQELANLNLTGTDLVVLSGCDTGLGDIRGSEGVFGLQRAVKMAGAKNLMMSLWPVPDGPTSQFMTAFYTNWRTGKPLHEAFAQTQQQFKKAYPPAVWAAFVLVE